MDMHEEMMKKKMPKGMDGKLPSGQVVQENMEPSGMEMAPTNAPTGPTLKMQFTDGKAGTSESIGLPQTSHTDQLGGPAPETSAKSL